MRVEVDLEFQVELLMSMFLVYVRTWWLTIGDILKLQ